MIVKHKRWKNANERANVKLTVDEFFEDLLEKRGKRERKVFPWVIIVSLLLFFLQISACISAKPKPLFERRDSEARSPNWKQRSSSKSPEVSHGRETEKLGKLVPVRSSPAMSYGKNESYTACITNVVTELRNSRWITVTQAGETRRRRDGSKGIALRSEHRREALRTGALVIIASPSYLTTFTGNTRALASAHGQTWSRVRAGAYIRGESKLSARNRGSGKKKRMNNAADVVVAEYAPYFAVMVGKGGLPSSLN